MSSLPLLSLVVLALACFEVKGKVMLYGEGVKSGDGGKEFREQLCPKPDSQDKKYVRIKTFNGKYVWAYNYAGKYVRTRCCEVKDALGRADVKVPGQRTTFLIHCVNSENPPVVRFEILDLFDRPSGYFFYDDFRYRKYGIRVGRPSKVEEDEHHAFNFIIMRKEGPFIAIRTQGSHKTLSQWLTFKDNDDGQVLAYNHKYNKGEYPSMDHFFWLEAVPNGCVINMDGRNFRHNTILAAPPGTGPKECESQPDSCYWNSGWDTRKRKMQPGYCYYNVATMCSWWRDGEHAKEVPKWMTCKKNGQIMTNSSPDECKAINCCYDYRRNQCIAPRG